ncbi:nonstructural protein 1 [Chapparvovirus sp.]|nr:nonstructural protein 1 [Chapparvovirus sp.]
MASLYSEREQGYIEIYSPEIPGAESQIRCTRQPRFFWRRGHNLPEEEKVSLIPEETLLNLCATEQMSQWICSVFLPVTTLPEQTLSDMFNDFSISDYIIISETNTDNVFHLHTLTKTTWRSDKFRKKCLEWGNNNNSVFTLAKCAACHSIKAMWSYMLKSPINILCSSPEYCDMSFSIISHNWHTKYQTPKQNRKQQFEDIKKKQIVDIIGETILSNSCKTLGDVYTCAADELLPYLHIPQLNAIIQNCLEWAKATGGGFSPYKLKHIPHVGSIHNILIHQNISTEEFDKTFYEWITKTHPKKNTILLYGPSNTGKTAFIAGLKQLIPHGEIQNTNSGFAFEALLDCYMGVWEEPLINHELAEKVKIILEGMDTMIPIKFKKPHPIGRRPIIMTSNHYPWRYCTSEQNAFINRMTIFNFFNSAPSTCSGCNNSRALTKSTNFSPSSFVADSFSTTSCNIQSTNQTIASTSSRRSPSPNSNKRRNKWSNSNRSRSTSPCPANTSTNSAGSSNSTSTTTSSDIRSSRENRPSFSSIRIHNSSTSSEQPFAGIHLTHSGNQQIEEYNKSFTGRRVKYYEISADSKQIGSLEYKGTWLQTQGKDQKEVGRETHTCLRIPTKDDWGSYIVWLICKYGR